MAKTRTRAKAPRLGGTARPTKASRARAAAAKRGWETRRANEEARRRSESAKRGWETRRKNEEAKREKRKRGGVVKRPPTPPTAEFAASARYDARKRGNNISVQIAMRAPEGATQADLQEALIYAIDHEGEAPKGYTIAIVDWRGREYQGGFFQERDENAWHTLSAPLALAELAISPIRKGEV